MSAKVILHMHNAETDLSEQIRDAIRARGPVTFAWFMEQALYHPGQGYYASGRAAIGRKGDYFTSVSVGPLFGRLLGAQFAEIWQTLGRPNDFTIVEQGAHDGQLARDVLEAARAAAPEFFAVCRYVIVEPFDVLRARQATTLAEFREKVDWHTSLDRLPSFQGVHFSNELIDAMPVHLVKWTGSEWLERHVALDGDGLVFVDLPLSAPELMESLGRVDLPLPAGYETEVNLAASRWIAALATKLARGYAIAADYGFARDEFYAPHRTSGTLRSYAQHRPLPNLFAAIGAADITAHVEWTSLTERALASGFRLAGFTDQHHFLTGLLNDELARELERSPVTARALQTLIHPGFLGMKFQFLVLSKNVEASAPLRGLRFARDADAALGLAEVAPRFA